LSENTSLELYPKLSPEYGYLRELSKGDNVVIKTSSYFNRTAEDILLPSPAEVRERALEKGFVYPGNPPPIRFPELGLIVKSGTNLTIAEAQCL
jgi:hypothetical protein